MLNLRTYAAGLTPLKEGGGKQTTNLRLGAPGGYEFVFRPVLAFIDAGRVYVDGKSPGGWHTVGGGGLWFGILDQGTGFSVTFTSSAEKRVLLGTGLRF